MARVDPRGAAMLALLVVLLVALYRVPASDWLTLGMGRVLDVLHAPVQWVDSWSRWFEERARLQNENARLRRRLEQQAAIVQRASALAEENRQLRALLDITNIEGFHWHAAKVLGRSPDTMSQRLILRTEQAKADDVVVSSEGLVGLVAQADGAHAVVRTILDASLAVPVTVPGSTLAGLARGQGDTLTIDFLPWEEAPRPGTVMYTSGAGGLFPPGIAVARVVRVRAVPGRMFAQVEAAPMAHWQRDNWLAIAQHGSAVDE
ncbi:MAG: rod shape-determining protein MreC [Zetaproteobacteria bacterium]|nr:MAG: rod shape-determining protein MreC [Zetaproteobacteria bacterium]